MSSRRPSSSADVDPIRQAAADCRACFGFLEEYGFVGDAAVRRRGFRVAFERHDFTVLIGYEIRDSLRVEVVTRAKSLADKGFPVVDAIDLIDLMATRGLPSVDDESEYAIPTRASLERAAERLRRAGEGLLEGDTTGLEEARGRVRERTRLAAEGRPISPTE